MDGKIGYVSALPKYVSISNIETNQKPVESVPSPPVTNPPTEEPTLPETAPDITENNSEGIGQKVIEVGLKYLGTPYEYGSTRSNKDTMDCSEFVMWAYREGANIDMGRSGSTSQSKYVKAHGTYVTDINQLKKGDLVFFMKYRGYKASDYKGIDPSTQGITHVALYIGDNKILHTFSKESGGVKITNLKGASWELRFVGGGAPYKN